MLKQIQSTKFKFIPQHVKYVADLNMYILKKTLTLYI